MEALIPTQSGENGSEAQHSVVGDIVFAAGRTVVNVSVQEVIPNARQPRSVFSEEALSELTDSIREHGIVQPILVRRQGEKYELIAGERRWRAAMQAGFPMIPAIVKNFSDEQALEIALIENIQREDLNAMEEADAYARLANEFGLTQEEIAQKVGKNRSTVANAIRLVDLPGEVKQGIREGKVTAGHVRPLLSLSSADEQLRVYEELLQERLNVRDVEYRVAERRATHHGMITRRRVISASPELLEVLNILLDYFGTKVKISGSSKRGRIILEYFSQEDLERLIELLTGKKMAERQNPGTENGVTEGEMHSLVDAGQT